MAKQRYVNTQFWTDTYICGLKPQEKLLYIYCLTNPNANICGIYENPVQKIAFEVGLELDDVLIMLKKFEEDDKIIYRDGWLAIKKFMKHQSLNPKILQGMILVISSVPDSLIKWVLGEDFDVNSLDSEYLTKAIYRLSKPIQALSTPIKPSFQTPDRLSKPLNYSNSNSNSNTNLNANTNFNDNPNTNNTPDKESKKPDSLPDDVKNHKKQVKCPEKTMSEEAIRLTQLFYDLLREYLDPVTWNKNPPNLNTWAGDIEKIHRIDGVEWRDIERVIQWVTKHNFWSRNVMSGATLRKQFTRLHTEAKSKNELPESIEEARERMKKRAEEIGREYALTEEDAWIAEIF